jgi:hypothetical protein
MGDVWKLRFVAADETVEVPPPFPQRVGFEHIFKLLYDPDLLARQFPHGSAEMPLTDARTLAKTRETLAELHEQSKHASPDELGDIEEQIKKAEAYIRDTTMPGGKLKAFRTNRKKQVDRFRNAINGALVF